MNLNPWDIVRDDFADMFEDAGTIAWKGKEWQLLLSGFAGSDFRRLSVRRLDLGAEAPLWHLAHKPDRFDSSPRRYGIGDNRSPQEAALLALQEGRMIRRYFADYALNLRSPGQEARVLFWLNANNLGGLHRKSPVLKRVGFSSPNTFFSWTSPKQSMVKEEDSLGWWQILQEEFATPTSDAAFALNFDSLSFGEKIDRVWKWKNGEYQQAREVLEAALLSQSELWEKDSVWRWDIQLPLHQDEKRYGFMRSVQCPEWKANSLPDLQHAAELVNDYFAPARDEHLRQASMCIQKWRPNTPVELIIWLARPTMHERMEALLLWQEWQKKMGG